MFVSAEEFHEIGLKIKSATSSCFAKQIENTNKTIVCVKFGWRSYFFFPYCDHTEFVNMWMSASSADEKKKVFLF